MCHGCEQHAANTRWKQLCMFFQVTGEAVRGLWLHLHQGCTLRIMHACEQQLSEPAAHLGANHVLCLSHEPCSLQMLLCGHVCLARFVLLRLPACSAPPLPACIQQASGVSQDIATTQRADKVSKMPHVDVDTANFAVSMVCSSYVTIRDVSRRHSGATTDEASKRGATACASNRGASTWPALCLCQLVDQCQRWLQVPAHISL